MVLRREKDNYLRTREHNLARDEDEEHDFRLDHTVDQTREELSTASTSRRVPQQRKRRSPQARKS